MASIFLTGLLVLVPSPVRGLTFVGGAVSVDTTWTLSGSPYVVVSDLWIAPGVQLTVEPGVVVKVNPLVDITVEGRLQSIGLPTAPIVFTSNGTGTPGDWYGISTSRGGRVHVEEALMQYAAVPLLLRSPNNVVRSVTFENGYLGVQMAYMPPDSDRPVVNNTIENSTFRGNTPGPGTAIVFFGGGWQPPNGGWSRVVNNTFLNNGPDWIGIRLNAAHNVTVASNRLEGAPSGFEEGIEVAGNNNTIADNDLALVRFGITLRTEASFNHIVRNTIVRSEFAGIYLLMTHGVGDPETAFGLNTIERNNVTDSGRGIRLVYPWSANNTFRDNILMRNGIGAEVNITQGPPNNNTFYRNRFINNTMQAVDQTSALNAWDVGCPEGGNFWSDYSGVDAVDCMGGPGPDGLGDLPYVIDADSRDNHPRMVASNLPPISSVSAVTPYWWTAAPLPVQASASDIDGNVTRVDLHYRFDGGAGWGPWTPYASDVVPPWSWSFPFPDGEGRYEFYSLAFDGTDREANKTAEASAGYDATPPTSSALPIVPYLHTAPPATVDATAVDLLSGVDGLTLLHAYSSDNVTFGPWTTFGTLGAPPWSWTFPFSDGEGYYRFHTIAWDVAGNVETAKTAAEAEAAYRAPDAPPLAIARASPMVVSIGETVTLNGTDSSDDKGIAAYQWDFGDGATEPNATAAHAYASKGTFLAVLTVWDSAGQNDTDAVAIDVVNRPPVADAGADQSVWKRTVVTLDGTGSYDPDGDPLAYYWDCIGGNCVPVNDATSPQAWIFPMVQGTALFRLTVDDGDTLGSNASTVSVTAWSMPPVANLTATPETVRVGATVLFDGSGSYDPDFSSIVNYNFLFGDGNSVTGPFATQSHAYAAAGPYAATLTVTDDDGNTSTAQVTVLVTANGLPTAVATVWPSSEGTVDTTFLFDGANSTDDRAVVAWRWDFGDGATAVGLQATHRYTAKGPHTVTLGVEDDEGATASATLTVQVGNRPPVISDAQPAASISIIAGHGQRFSVIASDPDGDPLTYAWTVDGVPVGTNDLAFDLTTGPGEHTVNVTVSDGELAAWHEWTVRVEVPPAGTNWKPGVAAVFAGVLVIVGAWSSRRKPWKGADRNAALRAFVIISLPFVLAEAATGVVSAATGLLSIPPLLGTGTAVDGGLLVAGVAMALLRARSGRASRTTEVHPPR